MEKEARNQHWRSRMEGKLLFQEPTAAVAMEGPRSQILPPIKSPVKLRKGALSTSAGPPSFHPPAGFPYPPPQFSRAFTKYQARHLPFEEGSDESENESSDVRIPRATLSFASHQHPPTTGFKNAIKEHGKASRSEGFKAKPSTEPPCLREGLPGLVTIRENQSVKAGVNLVVSALSGLQIHLDANFAAMSSKSTVGGFKHHDETQAVDLATLLPQIEIEEDDGAQMYQVAYAKLSKMTAQLEALSLMTYDDAFCKTEKMICKALVQELLWRVTQFSVSLSQLVEQACSEEAGLLMAGRTKGVFDWTLLEDNFQQYLTELSAMYASLGLVPILSSDGQIQWAHSDVSRYQLKPLLNGFLVLISTIQGSLLQMFQEPFLTPLLEMVKSKINPQDEGPVLPLKLPAPLYNKNLTEVLGIETREATTSRLLLISEILPVDKEDLPSSSFWLGEVSKGCQDSYLSSPWRSLGLFLFTANSVICKDSCWQLSHEAWTWNSEVAKVILIFSLYF